MSRAYDIQEELAGISSYMAAMPRTMPYDVPDGYFEQFGSSVDEHITQPWGKTLPYSVPPGYFETFTHNMVAMATGNITIAATDTPYTAPAGYFEALPEQLLRTVNALEADSTTGARIIPWKQRSVFASVRWVAAAVVLLGIGIGSYLTISNTEQDMGADIILASIPNSEIQEYVQGAYRVDVNRIVSNDEINNMALDNNDIITYLDETGWD